MLRATVVIAAALLPFGSVAGAATLRVPEDYPSILSAVDAAASGDSVLVGPGTWTQNATRVVAVNGQNVSVKGAAFLKPGITLIGTAGPAATIVTGDPNLEVFVHTVPGTDPILIEGFTATGQKSLLAAATAPVEMRSCWLVDNRRRGALLHDANVAFRDCLIDRNEWDESGPNGGALLVTNSTLELYDCTLRDNRWKAIRLDGAPRVVMDGCLVSGQKNNGACEFDHVDDLQIRSSTFIDNKSTGNGGALTILTATGAVEFCVFAYDSAGPGGGAISTFGGVGMTGNTFYGCAGSYGGAITQSGADAGFDHNIVASSSATDGAVWGQGTNAPETGCNMFWGNAGGDFSTVGNWTAAPTDLFADPQFCDPPNDDLTLRGSSPGAPTGPCGQIGALGVGCGSVSVESKSWGQIKGLFR